MRDVLKSADVLKPMDKQAYVARMQEETRRIMEQIADAINAAPTGNVINGSELEVRDLMAELRQKAFELGIQMRIDSSESTFSPSEGCVGSVASDEQGSKPPKRDDGQRSDQLLASSVERGGKKLRQRKSRRGKSVR